MTGRISKPWAKDPTASGQLRRAEVCMSMAEPSWRTTFSFISFLPIERPSMNSKWRPSRSRA